MTTFTTEDRENADKRSLAEEITEGFKAIDQLGLAESIVQQQALDIERLKGHLAIETKIRIELVEENKALKATIAQMTIDSGKELEIEEGRKHGNLVKFEELPAMTSQELLGEDRQALEDLVGSND